MISWAHIIAIVLTSIGAFFNGVFLVPQLVKLIKSKSAANLSLTTNIIAIICSVCWILYLTLFSIFFIDRTSHAKGNRDIQRFNEIILLVSSTADWGMLITSILLVIFQLNWMKKNKKIKEIKNQVKNMSDEEIRVKIKKLKNILNIEHDASIKKIISHDNNELENEVT